VRKSACHECRQAYNAQAAVDADESILVLASDVLNTTTDRAGLESLLNQMTVPDHPRPSSPTQAMLVKRWSRPLKNTASTR
jgi:hypothetical protein|tara:strand:+ start:224 stop:466 length:243 start_codon:yes stop_codon:yes gene_type:complete